MLFSHHPEILNSFTLNVCFISNSDGSMEHVPWAWSLYSRGIPPPITSPPPVLLGMGTQLLTPPPQPETTATLGLWWGPGHGRWENQCWLKALGTCEGMHSPLECSRAGGSVTFHSK